MSSKFTIKESISKNNEHYFVIIAGNGEPIAVSEMYSSKQMCEKTMKLFYDNLIHSVAIDENHITLFEKSTLKD